MSPREVETFLRGLATGDGAPRRLSLSRLHNLPAVWREFGYVAGAEIGVERGEYSAHLLEQMPELRLLSVDAWQAYPGYREHVSQEKIDGFYAETLTRLEPFAPRAKVIRDLSVHAAKHIPDRSLDFVYLDGNHTLPHVIADLAAWAPKVRPGGTVAGHDFGRSSVGHVREAVQAWTSAYRIDSWFIATGDRSPSWLWVVQ